MHQKNCDQRTLMESLVSVLDQKNFGFCRQLMAFYTNEFIFVFTVNNNGSHYEKIII